MVSKPLLSKFHEHDGDAMSMVTKTGEDSEHETDAKQVKIAKAVKRFVNKLTSTVSRD